MVEKNGDFYLYKGEFYYRHPSSIGQSYSDRKIEKATFHSQYDDNIILKTESNPRVFTKRFNPKDFSTITPMDHECRVFLRQVES